MQNFDLENENGRSMIEMLGVLAIIGVLSVGGIAGYSKAMQKYRINKTIEQITLIAGNIRSFFAPQRSYEGLGYCWEKDDAPDAYKAYCKLIKKAKLMPDEMWDDTDKQFNNVFGNAVNLHTAHKSSNTDEQAFVINYLMPNDYEICIELMSQDWTSTGARGIFIMTPNHSKYAIKTVPVSMEDAVNACSEVANAHSGGYYYMYFYFDVNSNCWDVSKGNPNTCS